MSLRVESWNVLRLGSELVHGDVEVTGLRKGFGLLTTVQLLHGLAHVHTVQHALDFSELLLRKVLLKGLLCG